VETFEEECNAPAEATGIAWVDIPAGTLEICCPRESPYHYSCDGVASPLHSVEIAAFQLMDAEVTESQFELVMCTTPSCGRGKSWLYECGGPHTYGDEAPVERIVWREAAEFCRRIGARLPTEAEWEYAARGGTTTDYYCGDSLYCQCDHETLACSLDEAHKHPVRNKPPNSFGLYDMLGNVRELVQDCWHTGFDGAPTTGYPGWVEDCWDKYGVVAHARKGGDYWWDWYPGTYVWSRSPFSDHADAYTGFRCARNNQM